MANGADAILHLPSSFPNFYPTWTKNKTKNALTNSKLNKQRQICNLIPVAIRNCWMNFDFDTTMNDHSTDSHPSFPVSWFRKIGWQPRKLSGRRSELVEQGEEVLRIALRDIMELSDEAFLESRDFLREGDRVLGHTRTDVETFRRHRAEIARLTLALNAD